MKKILMATAFAALIVVPNIASADPNAAGGAAAGAAVGAGAGFLIGGPVGAAVGAGVGGTMGAGSSSTNREVIVEQPARAPVNERTCTRDSLGNVVCQEIRR
jgi:hypothetical protein